MALIFFSGFEYGALFGWKSSFGSGASIQDTIKKTGAYALRVISSGTYFRLYSPNYTPNRISFYFRLSSNPSSHICIAGRSTGLQIHVTADRYLSLYDHMILVSTGLIQLSLDTWYRISCSYSPSTNTAKIYINGVKKFSETGLDAGDGIGYQYGIVSAVSSADVYFDNIIEDDTDSLEDLGNIEVLLAKVNGAGNYAEFEGEAGSETHWENVDEVPFSDADWNGHTSKTAVKESYSLENCSTIGLAGDDIIKAVRTHCRMAEDGTGSPTVNSILLRDNGVDDEVEKNIAPIFLSQSRIDNVMPNGGGAWTQARFDALEAGMSRNAGGKNSYISSVIINVAFSGTGSEPELPPDSEPEEEIAVISIIPAIDLSLSISWVW